MHYQIQELPKATSDQEMHQHVLTKKSCGKRNFQKMAKQVSSVIKNVCNVNAKKRKNNQRRKTFEIFIIILVYQWPH